MAVSPIPCEGHIVASLNRLSSPVPSSAISWFGIPLFSLAVFIFVAVAAGSVEAATIIVPSGGDFDAALKAANCGDEIILQAGASYTAPGPFTPFSLRYNGPCTGTDADYITIRTSNLAGIPAAGTRVTPANGPAMAKLITAGSSAVLEAEASAHHYRLIGIEFTNIGGSIITGNLINVGQTANGGYIRFPQHPHHITFDRCWIHEATNDTTTPDDAETTAERGFLINADDITVKECRIVGFRGFYKGTTDIVASNAILIPYAAQRVAISNNYLDAWFVPLFIGGTGEAETPYTATVAASPAPTLNRATLSNVNNLHVSDLIAFHVTDGTNPSGHVEYEIARVTAINGNVVDYVPQYSSLEATLQGGNPLERTPDTGPTCTNVNLGQEVPCAQWNGYNPTDILIERNQFVLNFNATEYVWTHTGGSSTLIYPFTSLGNGPKGFMEIKVGKRVTINGNTFEGWSNSMVISTRNQTNSLSSGGAPWATIEDLTITNNWWKRAVNWFRQYSDALGGPQLEDNEYTSTRGHGVLISNNLFEMGAEAFLNWGSSDNTTVIHNTYVGLGAPRNAAGIFITGSPNANFVMKDNIFSNNEYYIACQLSGLRDCYPGKVQTNNIVIDNRTLGEQAADGPLANFIDPRTGARMYANDYIVMSQSQIGWTNQALGNYRLLTSSPYHNAASDGTDVGIDVDALLAALNGSTPTPTPTPTATPTVTPSPSPSPAVSPTPSPTVNPTPTPSPSVGQFTISGTITHYDGTLALNTTVDLLNPDRTLRAESQSLGTGSFAFTGVPAGDYIVVMKLDESYQSSPSEYDIQGLSGDLALTMASDPNGTSIQSAFIIGPSSWFCSLYSCTPVTVAGSQTPVVWIVTIDGVQNGTLLAVNVGRQTIESSVDVTTQENFGSDKRTRLMIFAVGVSGNAANTDPSNDIVADGVVIPNLAESVIVEAHTPDGRVYKLPVEFAGVQGSVPGLDQVNVVLIPELQGAGTVDLTLIINGRRSNAPTIIIR